MKRTLQLSLLLLASLGNVAFSQIGGELTLKYGYTFNDSSNLTANAATDSGSQSAVILDVNTANNGMGYYSTAGVDGSRCVSQVWDLMQISNMNMSSAEGFTIAMALNAQNQTWSAIFKTDFFGTSSLTGSHLYQTTGAGNSSIYSAVNDYRGPASNSDWQAITLSVGTLESGSTQLTMTAFNVDGSIAATATTIMGGIVVLETFTQGNGETSPNNKASYLDNLLIYEGAADDAQLAQIANSVLTSSTITADMQKLIPEPSTATLSLLALAGLLVHRRRKTA